MNKRGSITSGTIVALVENDAHKTIKLHFPELTPIPERGRVRDIFTSFPIMLMVNWIWISCFIASLANPVILPCIDSINTI